METHHPAADLMVSRTAPRARQATVEDIEALYASQRLRFVRVAERILGDPFAANDAVQEAFVQALRKRRSFRNTGPLEAWIWRLVVNSSKASRRRATPESRAEVPERPDDPAPSSDGAAVRARIADLPERQKLALFLRYYADLDYETIAAVLGVRVGTVSSTLNQAHAAIRASLREDDR